VLPLMLLVTVPPPARDIAAGGAPDAAPTGVAAKAAPSTAAKGFQGDLPAAKDAPTAPAQAAQPPQTLAALFAPGAAPAAQSAASSTTTPDVAPVAAPAANAAPSAAPPAAIAAGVMQLARAFGAAQPDATAPAPTATPDVPEADAAPAQAVKAGAASLAPAAPAPARGAARVANPKAAATAQSSTAPSSATVPQDAEASEAGARGPSMQPGGPTIVHTGSVSPQPSSGAAPADTGTRPSFEVPAGGQPGPLATAPLPQPMPNVAATNAAPAASAAAPAPAPAHVVQDVALGNVPIEIGMKSLSGINHFEIRLAPNDLGGIEVRLQIDEDGRVKAHLTVDRPETLGFLQRDTGQLQQSLEQAGLKTGSGSIAMTLRDPNADSGTGQNRQNGDQQPQQQQHGSHRGRQHAQEPTRPDIRTPMQTRNVVWTRSSGIDRHI
jgi:flagellar hook-length control protein FliK